MNDQENTENQNIKVCRDCQEKITVAARKCKHCGSFQDNRRILNVGNAFLGLILAFLTLFSVIIPVSKEYLLEPKIKFDFELVDIDFDGKEIFSLHVLVSNSGERQGSIGNIVLSIDAQPIEGQENGLSTVSWFTPLLDADSKSFEPGQHREVIYEYSRPDFLSYGTRATTAQGLQLHSFKEITAMIEFLQERASIDLPDISGEFSTSLQAKYSTIKGQENTCVKNSENVQERIYFFIFKGY